MKKTNKTIVYSVFLLLFSSTEFSASAHRILFLSPIVTYSHSNFIKPIVKELIERGHLVTYWNGLLPKNQGTDIVNQTANLRQLYSPELHAINSDYYVDFSDRSKPFHFVIDLPKRMELYCSTIYRDPVFRELMDSQEKYDLIIVEPSFNECVLPLVYKFDVPLIYIMGAISTPWHLDAIGSPLAFDHCPHVASAYTDEMNFWQRTLNTLTGISGVYFWRWMVLSVADRLAAEMLHIENLPSIEKIESHYLSLLVLNLNFGFNYPMATTPAVIQAGGINLAPNKPLPDELENFVNASGEAGFIVVSFGTVLRNSELPDKVRRLFLSTFARLPQRILWRWEDQSKIGQSESIPNNVKMMSWLPQNDLLGHPKMRLFITHGGANSIQEAVYHKVPMIVMPVFVDQPLNAQKAQKDGYALRLDVDNLTEEILFNAIKQILSDPRYMERLEEASYLLRDQMGKPLDRAVYWIEYVIRHKGAPHLRTSSRKLSLPQRLLFDVMLFVIVIGVLILFLFAYVFSYFCCKRSIKKGNLKKTN